MYTWLLIYVISFGFWYVAILISYQTTLWKVGFPLGKIEFFKYLVGHLVPAISMLTILIYGLIKTIYGSWNLFSVNTYLLVLAPLIYLTGYLLINLVKKTNYKKAQYFKGVALELKKKECNTWLKNFAFLNRDQVDLRVFLSKKGPVGRLTIKNVTKEQKDIIEEYRKSMPESVKLWVTNRESYERLTVL